MTAGYSTTEGGDPNTEIQAVLNLPVIADTVAVRAVVYDERRGGYINNVFSTFTRQPTDLGIHYANYATACSAGALSFAQPASVRAASVASSQTDSFFIFEFLSFACDR